MAGLLGKAGWLQTLRCRNCPVLDSTGKRDTCTVPIRDPASYFQAGNIRYARGQSRAAGVAQTHVGINKTQHVGGRSTDAVRFWREVKK